MANPSYSRKRKRDLSADGSTRAAEETSQDVHCLFTEQQSLSAVETVLQLSVATVAWHRGLFPDHCYADQFSTSLGQIPGATVSDGSPKHQKGHQAGAQRRLKTTGTFPSRVLVRGRASACDRVLDWIDIILDNLRERKLGAVSFCIIQDRARPSQVTELYTFCFQYQQDCTPQQQQLIEISLQNTHGQSMVLTSLEEGFQAVIERLVYRAKHLPNLPDICFLRCNLQFRPTCRPEKIPKGFHRSETQRPFVPEEKDGRWEIYTSGAWNSGSHILALSVEYLACPDQRNIPLDLTSESSLPRSDVEGGSYKDLAGLEQLATEQSERRNTSSQDVSNDATVGSKHATVLGSHSRGATVTQNSQCTISLMQTQKSFLPVDAQDSLLQTQELPASLRQEVSPPKWRLKPSKLQQVIDDRHSAITSSPQSAYGEPANLIRCQCNSARIEGRTIRCKGCGTLQHQHCYGFLVDLPPPEHVCYRCLLDDSATARLQTLKRLCRLRRILWLICDEQWSLNAGQGIAERLGYDNETMKPLLNRLTEEGYIAARGPSGLEVVATEEQWEKRQQTYGDPLKYIAQFYDILRDTLPTASAEKSKSS